MSSVNQEDRKNRLIAISNFIVKKRKELGLSQTELGERIGVSRVTINNWEHQTKGMSPDYLVKLSDAVGLTIETTQAEINNELSALRLAAYTKHLRDIGVTSDEMITRLKNDKDKPPVSEDSHPEENSPERSSTDDELSDERFPDESEELIDQINKDFEKSHKLHSTAGPKNREPESSDDKEEARMQYMERRLLIYRYEKLNASARQKVMAYVIDLAKDEQNLESK